MTLYSCRAFIHHSRLMITKLGIHPQMQFRISRPCFTNLENASGKIKFDDRKFHCVSSFSLNSCGSKRKLWILWAAKSCPLHWPRNDPLKNAPLSRFDGSQVKRLHFSELHLQLFSNSAVVAAAAGECPQIGNRIKRQSRGCWKLELRVTDCDSCLAVWGGAAGEGWPCTARDSVTMSQLSPAPAWTQPLWW